MRLCSRCQGLSLEQLQTESGYVLHDDWASLQQSARNCRICAWIVSETLTSWMNSYHYEIDTQLSESSSKAQYDMIRTKHLEDPFAGRIWWKGNDISTSISLVSGADREIGLVAHIDEVGKKAYVEGTWEWNGDEFELKDCGLIHIMHFYVLPGDSAP